MDKQEAERLQREVQAMTGGVPWEHWVVSTLGENKKVLCEIRSTVKWHWKSIAGLAAWLLGLTGLVIYKLNGG